MYTATNSLTTTAKPEAAYPQATDLSLVRTVSRMKGVAKRPFYSLFALSFLLLIPTASRAETYQIIGTETSVVGGDLNKTVTTVQVGTNPINRFSFTKVSKQLPSQALKDVIFLLPPLGSGGPSGTRDWMACGRPRSRCGQESHAVACQGATSLDDSRTGQGSRTLALRSGGALHPLSFRAANGLPNEVAAPTGRARTGCDLSRNRRDWLRCRLRIRGRFQSRLQA